MTPILIELNFAAPLLDAIPIPAIAAKHTLAVSKLMTRFIVPLDQRLLAADVSRD
jgi:antibiotic biosynthesis monooxygenase (ABM) superfamily enzyme